MPAIRAFIAIEIPSDIKTTLKDLQSRLKRNNPTSIKWVEPANIHLTLKFLGNISTSQIDPVTSAMQTSVSAFHPFRLQIQALGAFPNFNRPQVLWVGLNGDLKVLLNLQHILDLNLSRLGFAADERPFSAHLTLGRVRDTATLLEKQNIGKTMAADHFESNSGFVVQSLNLMQSQLSSTGPNHTCLNSIRLTKSGP
jgi:RNA 2',3'-cyclic 3'-phosphodiesterase